MADLFDILLAKNLAGGGGEGEIEITENGTYDVSDKERAVVNIDCGSSDIDTYILGVLSFVPKGNVVEVN